MTRFKYFTVGILPLGLMFLTWEVHAFYKCEKADGRVVYQDFVCDEVLVKQAQENTKSKIEARETAARLRENSKNFQDKVKRQQFEIDAEPPRKVARELATPSQSTNPIEIARECGSYIGYAAAKGLDSKEYSDKCAKKIDGLTNNDLQKRAEALRQFAGIATATAAATKAGRISDSQAEVEQKLKNGPK